MIDIKDIEQIKSTKDFYTRFCPTEQKACEIYENIRWGGKLECPFCNGKKVYKMNNKKQPYKCGNCLKKYSVKTNTIMQSSHIPVQQWLYALYIMQTNTKGISSIRLAKELGVTQKTAWYMAQKIRECLNKRAVLNGIIEMDETFIGGKEKNKHEYKRLKQGRGTVGKTAVMGAISRESKQAIAYPVSTVSYDSVGKFIKDNVKRDSVIFADECPSYDKHTMLRVNHNKKQYVDGEIHTNNIESFWATIKRAYIGTFHHWSKKHLHRYINEFSFRFNRRSQNNIEFIYNIAKNGEKKVRTFKYIVG